MANIFYITSNTFEFQLDSHLISFHDRITSPTMNTHNGNVLKYNTGITRLQYYQQNSLLVVGWSYSEITVGTLFQEPFHEIPCWQCANRKATCLLTGNRSLVDKADAVFFYASLLQIEDLPPIRHQRQKWIFYTNEAPRHHISSNVNLTHFDSFFNITATYSSKATVQAAYGKCMKGKSNKGFQDKQLTSLLSGKNKTAAWFVSNCRADNKREEYVDQLKQFIDIDIYGTCGTLQCQRDPMNYCYTIIASNYWFYLAFENSNCEDYVTEKVFTILINDLDIIPVVYGSANYSKILPPHSFISAWDYRSPKELSKYLIYLAHNITAYKEYFRWREFYVCEDNFYMLDICNYLHANVNQQSVIPSVNDFWSYKTQCPENSRSLLQ